MRQAALFLSLCFAISAVAQSPVEGRRAFGAKDWAAMRVAHAIAVSPDARLILYRVDHGAEQGSSQEEWWLLNQDRDSSSKLNLPKDFSPSGFNFSGNALYGIWQVGGAGQFAIFSLQGLTPQSVPQTLVLLPRGVKSVTPSPDGTQFALTYDPRQPDALAEVRTIIEPDSTGVYVVRSDGTAGAQWCDSLNHISDLAWSPNSRSIAVVSTTPKIGFHTVSSSIDLCDQAGSHRLVERSHPISSIAWTSAGKSLAFLSTSTHVLTPDHLWTATASGGPAIDQTPALEGSALQLAADPRGTVWVSVQRGLALEVDEFSHGQLKRAYRWPGGDVELPVFSPYLAGPTSLAFTINDPKHASNVAVISSGALRRITNESVQALDTLNLAEVRPEHWISKDGTALEGIATFPVNYRAGEHYPFLILPHGGPTQNDTLALNPTAQILAARGYFVLQPEYRGSTGYGSAFLEAIYQHTGDRAYSDVESGTDFAIEQGWADPHRLTIYGWSEGGFLAAWTITQTHRYRAAIEGAGVTDWSSLMWTSDIVQTDFDERWTTEAPEAFRRFSAVDFADSITTPLLILHGAADTRVPTYQGLELFQILAARDKIVKMVTYPGSPHFPMLWQQRLELLDEICTWLAKYNS